MTAADVRAWHAPRPWRVEVVKDATPGDVARAWVVDADGAPVTVTLCRHDAERIARLGNDSQHAHPLND